MDEEPQQTEQELGEPAADAESPGGGGETGDHQVAEPPVPPHETRHSRRRFILIVGAVVAGLIGALEVLRHLGGSGVDVTGGAAQSVQNMLSSFPINAVEHIPTRTWSDWTLKVD